MSPRRKISSSLKLRRKCIHISPDQMRKLYLVSRHLGKKSIAFLVRRAINFYLEESEEAASILGK